MIVNEEFLCFLLTKFLKWIGPENITHETMSWGLTESIDALEIIQGVQFRTETSMNTEKLLVHNSGQRQSTERIHTSFIYTLRILVLTLKFEGKVVSQMTTLVISTKKP